MEEERSNPAYRSKAWPIVWIALAGIAIALGCFSGTAGYIAAKLSETIIISEVTPIYIQCATTFIAFLVSTCETIALVSFVRWIKWKMNIEKRRQSDMATSNTFQETITLRTEPYITYREFSGCDILGIYIGTLGINIGIVLIVWCLTIAQSYQSNSYLKGSLWPFIVIDVIVGIVSPVMIIFSILPIAKIVRYISHNRLETRKLLLWFLPFLGYEKGSKGVYWVLEDSFYHNIHNGICGNLSTALLYMLGAFTFLFSWVHFIDDVLVEQKGLSSCMQLNPIDKPTTYCFHIHPTDLNTYINCTGNYTDYLFCFGFNNAGNKATGILQSAVISIILYYITVIFISLMFQVSKFLQRYARSYLWPTLLVATGFLVFIFGIVHFISALYFNYYLNVLTLFQILIASANIIVVGILVGGGQLMHDQQSLSENTSIVLNSYQIVGNNNSNNGNRDSRETSRLRNPVLSPHHDSNSFNVTPENITSSLPGDTRERSLSPANSNSLPPPSSTPPPPISPATTLESTPEHATPDQTQTPLAVTDDATNKQEEKEEGNNTVAQQISEGETRPPSTKDANYRDPRLNLQRQSADQATVYPPNYFLVANRSRNGQVGPIPVGLQYANIPASAFLIPTSTPVPAGKKVTIV